MSSTTNDRTAGSDSGPGWGFAGPATADGATLPQVSSTRWAVSAVAAVIASAAAVGLLVAALSSGFDSVAVVIALSVVAVLAAAAGVWSVFEGRRIAGDFRRTIERLGATESELRVVLDDLPEAVIPIAADGTIRAANARAGVLSGRSPARLPGLNLIELVDTRRRRRVVRWLRSASASNGDVDPITWTMTGLGGATVEVEGTLERSRRGDGGFVVRLRDVTELRERSRALEQARRRFQQAFHSAPTGMTLVRLDDSIILDANEALAEMLETPIERLVGQSIRAITHPDDLRAAAAHRARLELGIADAYLLDQRYLRSDGEYVWARTRVAIGADDGVPVAITHIEDVTEQRRAAEQLQWAATHDPLTELPNRTGLVTAVDDELRDAATSSVGLLFIDLDHFKTVNDSLGHALGDTLLSELAVRLKAAERPGAELLGRFGGDEFIVMVTEFGDLDGLRRRADEYRAAIVEPVVVEGTELFVTCSIGFSVNDRDGVTAAELLRDADAAMYRAKARGRNCVEGFAAGDQEVTALALRTANELRRGLERGEIVPYFQPIVELTSGHVVGFEALARWLHPDRGLLTPDQFLPLAEETGLIGEVSSTVLRDALSQLARWRWQGLPFADASLSVNVGTRQIVDPAFAAAVAEALAESGVDADALWLEITESALLADVAASTVALRNLRSLGVHLVVDDFGTGYSSLTYLKRFPVEGIKIDKGFVAGLGLDNDDSTIVEAVVRLGRSLGIGVVAEGVETPLQLARLRELECERGQGYLFGRPRPASIVEAERAQP